MSTLAPRVVVVHRSSELDGLLARHATIGQAEFFLHTRGRTLDQARDRHESLQRALSTVSAAIPADWRRAQVERSDLDRFAFSPQDIVLAVGQDGLVANVAKYLHGQPVVGVDPEPGINPGVLVLHRPQDAAGLLAATAGGQAVVKPRAMVAASSDDEQVLVALNEVYVGHPTHQSARYRLRTPDGRVERQSGSGVVIGTGTGASGWCASLAVQRGGRDPLPRPDGSGLAWFVREPWPSPSTGTALSAGMLEPGDELALVVESDGLVVFGDGIETDRLTLSWGQQVRIGLARQRLSLVCG